MDFNSQPREGGWGATTAHHTHAYNFNSQPREGGWTVGITYHGSFIISTHSRAKAAGFICYYS